MTVVVGETVGTIQGVRVVGPGSELLFDDVPMDVFIDAGVVVDIAPAGALRARGAVLDGHGGFLLPGFWDHHVHTVQWALAAQRLPLEDVASAAEAAARMSEAEVLADGRRIGSGFRDALWSDHPTLAALDAATGEVPTYLINADVHSVWLNSAALRREGFDSVDGVLREAPAFEISRRLNAADEDVADEYVARAGQAAAARGVVGLVDFDMAWNEGAWGRRLTGGFDALRVEFGVYPDSLDRALAEGLRTGDRVRGVDSALVRVGALKAISDGSLGTRTAACSHPYTGDADGHGIMTIDPSELVELMTRATAGGLACAIHAIGDVANSSALDAFQASGASGTIEHAQLVAHADVPRFARLGIGASVQPEHALDDRDLVADLWAGQTSMGYPLGALADAGANLLFGSDAPVSPLDPWKAIASAVYRTRGDRAAWHPEQAVSIETALAASTHGGSAAPAAVAPGARADLIVVESDPRTADERSLRSMAVRSTLLGGRTTHVA